MADIVREYITHGWQVVAIPPASKGPSWAGWNERAGALRDVSVLPQGYGVGLMHAYSGTMALDVDDWQRTMARGIDVEKLYAMPDAVTILSGKPGHGKLLYRMPMGIVLPSKKFQDDLGRGLDNKVKRINVFELRCGTLEGKSVQDVLPPSVHPETQAPYQWGGAGHWTRLPVMPSDILEIWREALKDVRPATIDGVDSSWDEIREALAHIDPDCSREDWVNAGMAIHWAGEQTFNPDQAYAVWNGWSRQGKKYPGEQQIAGQWRSFRANKSSTVTLGTLFHIARQHGWTRAIPDASTLFSDLSKMVKPEDIAQTMRVAPPDIDLSLWPPILAKRAQEVSDSVGCDPVVPLWAGLAAFCGVIDAQTRLELMSGFKVPPILWLMTVGDPGDRKSPGSRPMLAPLRDIEASDRQRYAKEREVFDVREATWAAGRTAMLKWAGSSDGLLGGDPPACPPKPDEPVPLKITVSDITSQELVRKAAQRPRGLLAYFDEMNSWVGRITNRLSGENRSAWVVGYESERYEMDRVGSGVTHCENFALSIYGNMQPQVLDEHFANLAQDGLLQRFMPAVLRHDKTRLNQPVPDYLTSAAAWENTLRLAYAMPPKTYRLSPEAYQVFRNFQAWYEDRMHSERLMRSSPEFVTAFGKITGLAGRLILIFHALESPFGDVVPVGLVERVIRIVRQFIVPTYRYVFDQDGSMSAFDQWMMEYIIQYADVDRITMSELKRSARRPFEKAGIKQPWAQNEWVIASMLFLEKMGWVARVDDGSAENRGHAEWMINPHLKTTFRSYREAVVRAKLSRNIDRIERAGADHIPPATHGAADFQL